MAIPENERGKVMIPKRPGWGADPLGSRLSSRLENPEVSAWKEFCEEAIDSRLAGLQEFRAFDILKSLLPMSDNGIDAVWLRIDKSFWSSEGFSQRLYGSRLSLVRPKSLACKDGSIAASYQDLVESFFESPVEIFDDTPGSKKSKMNKIELGFGVTVKDAVGIFNILISSSAEREVYVTFYRGLYYSRGELSSEKEDCSIRKTVSVSKLKRSRLDGRLEVEAAIVRCCLLLGREEFARELRAAFAKSHTPLVDRSMPDLGARK